MLECDVLLEKIMLRSELKSERTAMCYIRNWNDDDWSLNDHELHSLDLATSRITSHVL